MRRRSSSLLLVNNTIQLLVRSKREREGTRGEGGPERDTLRETEMLIMSETDKDIETKTQFLCLCFYVFVSMSLFLCLCFCVFVSVSLFLCLCFYVSVKYIFVAMSLSLE